MSVLLILGGRTGADELPSFRQSAWFNEQVREQWIDEGVRVLAIAAGDFAAQKPTRLVIFATPNGNTIEQSLGRTKTAGQDFRFDIQHIAAQIRQLRAKTSTENIVLACIEAEGLSWPAWKRRHADGPQRIRSIVAELRAWVPAANVRISLTCHSGGGSFLFGYIDGAEQIANEIDRLVFLDANYSYSDADKHGDKILAWLKDKRSRRLIVVAYDDREITLNGKKVVGPDGGTFRATERMRLRLAKDVELTESKRGDFTDWTGRAGQIALHVHANPKNAILHTALVGEMNGLLRGLDDETVLAGPRTYGKFIQPAPGIPARPKDALGGVEIMRQLQNLKLAEREAALVREITRGNFPEFLREFATVAINEKDKSGKQRTAVIEVMPDYLAVGSNLDFVRVPLTPMSAARIADTFGCALPTRKLVDTIHSLAAVKLAPRPMTKDREAITTFLEHNILIERQREGHDLGKLISGIKKDVVVTNRLGEKPNRVAIYGWHKLDSKPIQPLTIVHWNKYVDYSHGIRLLKRTVSVDGKTMDIRHAQYTAELATLFGDEGPLIFPTY